MQSKYGLWMGQPIEDLSKEELIKIIQQLDYQLRAQSEQFMKDLEFFAPR